MTAKNQDSNQLEETIDEGKSDLEMREDEISTLVFSEKEESQKKSVEKLQEEQRIASLAGDYGHLESRIYEIGNELKVVVNWITGNDAEKDQLKKEIVSLLQQLKDEKGKESVMREKIEEMEMRL
ncbi:hypothetical protein C2S52_005591 [Perilla frutescens var. hirtella]|nr:hypothetical protein C2S51_010113 [Perilla frutescens var. frutescens]KAH6795114.1 hypothetical protein C2S52_005591 [Perilla frutescens var. hirtella]